MAFRKQVRLHFVFVLSSLILTGFLAVMLSYFSFGKSAYADDTWYLGKGAKKDMFVIYQLQQFDTNNDRPFKMMIYFKDQDSQGNWIAPAWVDDNGKVLTATLKLSSVSLSPLGSSNYTADMATYLNAYSQSLGWISAFASVGQPQSLSGAYWGKIAAIGGAAVAPTGKETVTVPGGTFDATVVGWHTAVDDKLWIVQDFPYPVKALTYAQVSTGQPPIQFAFDLLQTGTGQPPQPPSTTSIPTPPLKGTTGRGTFSVELNWLPVSIKPGDNTTFVVGISDNTGFPVNQGTYDLTVKSSDGTVLKDFKNEGLSGGLGRQIPISFDNAGSFTITVTMLTVSGQAVGGLIGFTESVDFPIIAVPEFPVPLGLAIVAGGMVGLAILLTRFGLGTFMPHNP